MTQAYRRNVRKFASTKGVLLPDGPRSDNNRIKIGPKA